MTPLESDVWGEQKEMIIRGKQHIATGTTSRRLGLLVVESGVNLRSLVLGMLTIAFLFVYAPASAMTRSMVEAQYPTGLAATSSDADEALTSGTETVTTDSVTSDSVVTKPKLRTPVFAIKNNLLYDAVLTPNLTFEVKLAKRWTLQAEVGFNPFPLDDTKEHKWRHILVDLEGKYWFCEAFHQGFIGVNAGYSHFNVAKGYYPVGWLYKDVLNHRVQGDAVMAGVSGGWQWVVSKHVGIELEAGVDAGYAWFDRFECPHCGAKIDSPRKWFAVPKAGVNISILLPGEDRDDCPCRHQKEDEDLASKAETEAPENVEPAEPATPAVEPVVEPVVPVVVIPEPEPEPVLSAPERLQSPVLASYSDYKPYSQTDVVSKDSTALYVYFPTDSFNIDREFANNGVILDSILYIVGELMKDSLSEMKMIQIVGFASFDGPIKRNNMLAQGRAEALKGYIQEHLNVPDSLFEVNNGGEAWAELEYAVEQSDYKLKDKVLKIIREEKSPYKRELRLKELNLGWTYVYLRDELLAKYRNAGYIKVYYSLPESE